MAKLKRKAHEILAERRFKERQRLDALDDTLRRDALYSILNSERIDLRADIVRLASQNKDNSLQKAKYDDIIARLDKRIEELGVRKEMLKPNYVCPLCKDTGFVDGEECSCLKQVLFDLLKENCGNLPTEICDFSQVDYSIYTEDSLPRFQKYYSILERISEKFPNNDAKIIGVYGAVGIGKTHGISVLANNLMKKGFSVCYLNSAQMNSIFLKYHLAKEGAKQDIWEPLIEADLLILDDLGAEPNINNVTVNYLYCLLEERFNKTTCFTSNLSEIALRNKYNDRVFSRLSHKTRACIIKLKGMDLRIV